MQASYLSTVDKHAGGFAFGSLFGAILTGCVSPVGIPFAFIESAPLGCAVSVAAAMTVWQSLKLYSVATALEKSYGSERGNKIIAKMVLRRSRKLDRQYGWRPRRGVLHPKGRTDTYPRFLLDVQGQDNAYILSISHWKYTSSGWTLSKSNYVQETADSEAEMLEKYTQMSQQAIELNNNSKQHWDELQGSQETSQAFVAQLNAHKPGV